jgi:hypothetical protein
MSVTADTVKFTADSHYPTADGFVPAAIAAAVVETAGNASGIPVTADTTAYTADATWPTADGFVPGNVIPAEVVDAVVIAADVPIVVEAADALDQLDATVEAAAAVIGGGGARYYPPPRPFPVEGVGYGVLPQLEGEAHGTVGVAGDGEVDDDFPNDLELMLLMLAA